MNDTTEKKAPNVSKGNRARTHAMGSISPTSTPAPAHSPIKTPENTPPTTPRTTSIHFFVSTVGAEHLNNSLECGYISDESDSKELETSSNEPVEIQHKP